MANVPITPRVATGTATTLNRRRPIDEPPSNRITISAIVPMRSTDVVETTRDGKTSEATAAATRKTAADGIAVLALTLLASLFFMWGFITVINNTLLPHLRTGHLLVLRSTVAPHTTEFVSGYLGVLRAQGVAVPVNPRSSAGELARMIADSGSRLVLADAQPLQSLGNAGKLGEPRVAFL